MAKRKSIAARRGKALAGGKDDRSRTVSKQAACVALLEQVEGATITELQRITGWQQHSIRGFLAGTLKKKLGLHVTSTKEDRGRVYRVTSKKGF